MKKKWVISVSALVMSSLVLAGCGQAKPAATANNNPQLPSGTNSDLGPDKYIGFFSGGISGSAEVIGIPSLKTLRLIPVGVDTHEPVFSGSNKGGTNGTPDGKYVYLNDKGDSSVGVINMQTQELVKKINIPGPFGPHHIAITPDGKYLFATGELSGKMAKIDLTTDKVEEIDVSGGTDSSPDYLAVTKDGKYCLATDYYKSGVHVLDVDSFKEIKFIPAGKNPHGIDITADNKYAVVDGKLSGNLPIIDISKMEVVKNIDLTAPVDGFAKSAAPGPLHNVFTPDGKYAYTTLFVDNAIAKIDMTTLEMVKKIPVHYRPGHLQITPDGKYVLSINKFSTGMFPGSTTNQDPSNVELIDTSTDKVINVAPTIPEPHNAKIIAADMVKGYEGAEVGSEGETVLQAPHKDPQVKATLIPEDKTEPGVYKKDDGVVEIHMQEFSYGMKPDNVTVHKGDKVRIILTNTDKKTAMTNDPAPMHGFIINEYGLQTNWGVPEGKSVVFEFNADKAGKFAYYCSYFCGPLHLEMRGWFNVEQ